MLAVYAIARLLQVPLEATTLSYRWILLLIISLPAIGVIAYLAIDLILGGSTMPQLPQMPR
jgi:hypothetical protein